VDLDEDGCSDSLAGFRLLPGHLLVLVSHLVSESALACRVLAASTYVVLIFDCNLLEKYTPSQS